MVSNTIQILLTKSNANNNKKSPALTVVAALPLPPS
jgi:hypothetical protein